MRHVLYLALVFLVTNRSPVAAQTTPPNIVIIFADDLGYGDLGSYGHPSIATPNLDRMAAEGQRWTSFYVGASVCSPSRAALLTGRLPVRIGMYGTRGPTRVLFPDSPKGLPPEETTLAEVLKQGGYRTAVIGKWHLGHHPESLPGAQGFDESYGIPYSNDMDSTLPYDKENFWDPKVEYWNVPLWRNGEIIEQPVDQTTITRRYTDEAIRFIEENRDGPFFLYLPHTMPHVPLFRSESFEGRSRRGIYGDVVEEIDWSVGRILSRLRELGIEERTLVVFTSDNGPWLLFDSHGGSAGLLQQGKGTTWEGGMRVPAIFWWPGRIAPGTVREPGTTMDLFATATKLAGGELPSDRPIDGLDLSPALLGTGPSPRNIVYFYRYDELYALRKGPFKAHFITQGEYGIGPDKTRHDPPLLYQLEEDPGEHFDVAARYPEILADLVEEAKRHRAEMKVAPSIFDLRPE